MGRNELVFALLTIAFSALLLTSETPFWIAFVAGAAMFTVLWLISLPTLHLVVVLEERELRQRFGAAYDAYARQVPRYLPRAWVRRNTS